jgi:hypothetical protein
MRTPWKRICTFFSSVAIILFATFTYTMSQISLDSFKPPEIVGREFRSNEYGPDLPELPEFSPTLPFPSDFSSISFDYAPLKPAPFTAACNLCWLVHDSPFANSSPRDLILSFIDSRSPSFSPIRFSRESFELYRSLRTSECNATIVLLVEDEIAENISTVCGITVIPIGTISEADRERVSVVKHYILSKFLSLYRKDFDRVIICNPDLTLVQGDPFTSHFNTKTCGLARLSTKIVDSPILNELQIVDHYYESSTYANYKVISDSVIYGSINAILRFYEIVMKHDRLVSGKVAESFEAYLNYCYVYGFFEKKHLQLVFRELGDDFTFLEDPSTLSTVWDPSDFRAPKSVRLRGFTRPPLFLALAKRMGFVVEPMCIRKPPIMGSRKFNYVHKMKSNGTLRRSTGMKRNWHRH